MHNRYPFLLSPVCKSAIWGGERLRRDWGKSSNEPNIAETWELTVRERECCTVRNGIYAGKTLSEVLTLLGDRAIGADYKGKHFPLLIKFIDANDRLSVQVHPDDAYAATTEDGLGKTEVWHVIEACEGAQILYSLREDVTREDFIAAVKAGDFLSPLAAHEVHAGETYFIPAGMPHAIGAGILIAEIQQNCDLTYRVYDYDRVGADGNKRPLHVAQALDVVRPFSKAQVDAIRFARGRGDGVLTACPYFTVRRLCITEQTELCTDAASFHSLLVLDGSGRVCAGGECVPFTKGDSIFLPADCGAYTLFGNATILLTTL